MPRILLPAAVVAAVVALAAPGHAAQQTCAKSPLDSTPALAVSLQPCSPAAAPCATAERPCAE